MNCVTRRTMILGYSAGAMASLVGCSQLSGKSGWDDVDVDGLHAVVPSGWKKTKTDSDVWVGAWESSNKKNRLLLAPILQVEDIYGALRSAISAARAATRGFRVLGERTAVSGSGMTVIRQDYSTDWPLSGKGTFWAVQVKERYAVINFAGADITDQQRSEVGKQITLDPSVQPSGATTGGSSQPTASSAPGGMVPVRAEGVSLVAPQGWVDTHGIKDSKRWTSGWAKIDNSVVQARLLVAPEMPQKSVQDAIAQIEVDHAGGTLPGYKMRSRSQVIVQGAKEAVRTDFVSGSGGGDEGCLWIVSNGSRVSAVQYNVVGQLDSSIRDSVEKSLKISS